MNETELGKQSESLGPRTSLVFVTKVLRGRSDRDATRHNAIRQRDSNRSANVWPGFPARRLLDDWALKTSLPRFLYVLLPLQLVFGLRYITVIQTVWWWLSKGCWGFAAVSRHVGPTIRLSSAIWFVESSIHSKRKISDTYVTNDYLKYW